MAVWNAIEIEAGLHGVCSSMHIGLPDGPDLEKWGGFIRDHVHLQPIDFSMVTFITSSGVKRTDAVFWFPQEFLAYIDGQWMNTTSIEAALIRYVKECATCDIETLVKTKGMSDDK